MKITQDATSSSVYVENSDGKDWSIGTDIVGWECYGADEWVEEKAVTKTEMAELLHNAGQLIFKVRFDKQDGEERVLVGHLVHGEELMGRAQVVDLNVEAEYKNRQVDYRTLKELVIGGVHYTLKGAKKGSSSFINGEK
jgi:hypothetical protein